MKRLSVLLAVATALSLLPIRVQAFSEGFKKDMTTLQTRVMLRGEKFSFADVKKLWSLYDNEIIDLLSQSKKVKEEDLNKETQKLELMVTETKGTEIDDIELGDISAHFQQLDTKGQIWLVILYNGMYQGSTPLPYSTLHVYKEVDGKFTRTEALEEIQGAWDKDQIQLGSIQFQNLGGSRKSVKFATFHVPPKRSGEARLSRSEIVWEYQDDLKALDYIPTVD